MILRLTGVLAATILFVAIVSVVALADFTTQALPWILTGRE